MATDRPVILGIDAGTTGVRTFAIDAASTVVRSSYREFPQHFPQPGRVEHDAEEIWAATLATLTSVAADCAAAGDDRCRDRDHEPARDDRRVGPRHGPCRCTERSSGRTDAPRRRATSCAKRATSRWSATAPASCSTRTSRPPSWTGCCGDGGVDARPGPRVRHRRLVDPLEAHRRSGARHGTVERDAARCSSTSARARGPTSSARCSTSRRRACPRSSRPAAASG